MLYNYNSYTLNEANKIDKLKQKISKWFPVEFVVDKALELHPKLAVWMINNIINDVAKEYQFENNIKSYEEARKYVIKHAKDKSINELFFDTWNKNSSKIRDIIDWVKSYGISDEDRKNLTKMSLDEAYEKATEWHSSLKAGGEMDIEEDGEILIQYDDGFYWVDLKTTNSDEEADCMGHCGRTDKGTTIYSLRRKLPNGKIACHVTSAVDDDEGIIYQMKGKNNTKPIDKYHKYIVDLLIDDKLKIKGFGREYSIEDDFSVEDLNKELRLKLHEKKPDIESIQFTEREIEDMFDRYLDNYYGPEYGDLEYGFNSVEWLYNLTDYETVMKCLTWNDKTLFNIIIKEYADLIWKEIGEIDYIKSYEEFRERYFEEFSSRIPAEKIAPRYNVEIDEKNVKLSAYDNWQLIFKVLNKDDILDIAKEYGIDIDIPEDEKWDEFVFEYEDDVESLLVLLFEDEKKIWEVLHDLFYNYGDLYGKQDEKSKRKKEIIRSVFDVWDWDAIRERISEEFSTEDKLREMEMNEYYEVMDDGYY